MQDSSNLLVCGGEAFVDGRLQSLDIEIHAGKIRAVGKSLPRSGSREIDASGKLVFPGFIDAHTHMGIPILDTFSADDFESGSRAAACGGVTSIFDFTVQAKGQSLRDSLDKRLALAGRSHVDYGLHVNVTDRPERAVEEIPDMVARGFSSFKVFSTYKSAGMMLGEAQFRDVLRCVHSCGGLLLLHAEDNDTVERLTSENLAAGDFAAIRHARSRTAEAEARAISRAADIAGELGASLYIVHLSSRAGLKAALAARGRGISLHLETCPQYLLLTEERYGRPDGHFHIATPPLRTRDDADALWEALAQGSIDVVATDHCPFTAAQKNSAQGEFHRTPNGLPGVETLFPLLYTFGVRDGRISLERLVRVLAENPARIFGVSDRKGGIRVGADGDLVVWNPSRSEEIRASRLHGKADWSPYEGIRMAGTVDAVVLRGRVIAQNGEFTGQDTQGQLLRHC